MFWYASTLLCVFTFLIRTRTFFPTPPPAPPPPPPLPRPHLSCATSVSCEGPQAASLPSFHSSSSPPPCEFPANPRRLAGSISLFLPPSPVSSSLVHKERVRSCQSCSLPSVLRRELLSRFFKFTHSSYTQNSVLKMHVCSISGALGAPGRAGGKLARLVRSWARWF